MIVPLNTLLAVTYCIFIKVDSENINDLQRFACRRISVSYAAVNRFGASVESPPVLLTIPGNTILHRVQEH